MGRVVQRLSVQSVRKRFAVVRRRPMRTPLEGVTQWLTLGIDRGDLWNRAMAWCVSVRRLLKCLV